MSVKEHENICERNRGRENESLNFVAYVSERSHKVIAILVFGLKNP